MKDPSYLGVDLGGTQLRMAAVTSDGKLAGAVETAPTGRNFTPADLTTQTRALYERVTARLANELEIAALGVGTAGVLVDDAISQSDNLPRLNGCNLKLLLAQAVGLPVEVENDANCFALAEARFGAGRGAHHLVGVTLGTGVGSGVIVGGRIHRGAHGAAGEVYRIPLRDHYLEYYLSGAGVARNCAGAGEIARDGAHVAELARAGNRAALSAWKAFAADLHFLCECVIALIDPQVIVIGGSLAQARDLFEAELARLLGERPNRIAYAELGTAAGVIGAAALNI